MKLIRKASSCGVIFGLNCDKATYPISVIEKRRRRVLKATIMQVEFFWSPAPFEVLLTGD